MPEEDLSRDAREKSRNKRFSFVSSPPPLFPISSPNAHPFLSLPRPSSLSIHANVPAMLHGIPPVGGGDTGIVSLRWYIHCNRANPRAPRVYGYNRLFRVDLCGALRQNVRRDPA